MNNNFFKKSDNTRVLRKDIFSRARRIVIKIGSSVLTCVTGLDSDFISGLADDVALLKKNGYEILIVSSGAIAAGAHKIGLKDRPVSIPQKQASAAVGQGYLMQVYEEAFERQGLMVAQLLLTSDDMANRRRYLNARNTINTLFGWGIISIINENDTVVIKEIKFGDNDNLAALITNLIEADIFINLTDIDGLYNGDPCTDKTASIIKRVDWPCIDINSCIFKTDSDVGTGGMLSKVQAAQKACMCGTPTIIASGREKNIIRRLFSGEDLGTIFMPGEQELKQKKHWIAFALKPMGNLIVDKGASDVILQKGTSLLPSGIIEINGDFDLGDPVRILDVSQAQIAVGLVNYTSKEINIIKGKRSVMIESFLGYKHSDEVIHRDNLVIVDDNLMTKI